MHPCADQIMMAAKSSNPFPEELETRTDFWAPPAPGYIILGRRFDENNRKAKDCEFGSKVLQGMYNQRSICILAVMCLLCTWSKGEKKYANTLQKCPFRPSS
jgi:hypothetical protein